MARTPELADILLHAGATPHRGRNNQGKTAYEVQSPEIRAAIDDFTLLCGRFEVIAPNTPAHATLTSVVLLSTDKRAADDDASAVTEVAIKLMMHEDQFLRELLQRKGLDP